MGGIFGVAAKRDCTLELFYGIDYHSHLGTRRAGIAVHGKPGFQRAIHNIENSPFRTKFEKDIDEMEGNMGIGCIVYTIVAYAVGWMGGAATIGQGILIAAIQLGVAFIIWFFFMKYYRAEAKKMNDRIQAMK